MKTQRIEQKVQQNRSQQVKNNSSVFSKIKNRITHTYQNQKQILQQIDQSTTKNDQYPSSQTHILMQTPKMTHKRTQSKDLSKKLKLKDYIRLNQISREKRSQSGSINKLKTNKSLTSATSFDPLTTFNPHKQQQKEQQSKKVEKRPLRPYQKQIQLQKGQLLLTTQKARDKFQKIMNLIEQTNEKMSGYNDLVFMFNIEEMLNNYILKGMEQIRQAYSEHFAEMIEDNVEISTIKKIQNISPSKSKKEKTSMSPAARAQFKALEEIYLLGSQISKKNLPVSFNRSVTQFDEIQSESQQLNRTNPEIRKRQRS